MGVLNFLSKPFVTCHLICSLEQHCEYYSHRSSHRTKEEISALTD
jgi:FixJ family two-component response regulator